MITFFVYFIKYVCIKILKPKETFFPGKLWFLSYVSHFLLILLHFWVVHPKISFYLLRKTEASFIIKRLTKRER
jgi:hypothetical protein